MRKASRLPHARGGVSQTAPRKNPIAASSPRTWGCFIASSCRLASCGVFPTHVGVFPCKTGRSRSRSSLPHARGGVSPQRPGRGGKHRSSPRTWGCFRTNPRPVMSDLVFPTHVGVFPGVPNAFVRGRRLPHARGGVSIYGVVHGGVTPSSPRTWGCFLHGAAAHTHAVVFPTHVGVFLSIVLHFLRTMCLPHARGGVSFPTQPARSKKKSSPRTWGCFCLAAGQTQGQRVFPTHVGVFPLGAVHPARPAGLPHARGGVSAFVPGARWRLSSSPRTWGCFRPPRHALLRDAVFPTHVGVFPLWCSPHCVPERLPHARGGVSVRNFGHARGAQSSPRTWGCFSGSRSDWASRCVFPTHVGVFPHPGRALCPCVCLPHARGGVSWGRCLCVFVVRSSPRTWGCFPLWHATRDRRSVFPTHVGVFPARRCPQVACQRLPHARGGVSTTPSLPS